MNDNDISFRLSEALNDADESIFPDELLADWEPIECLAKSNLTETYLTRRRNNGMLAVAKLLSPEQPETSLTETLKTLDHPNLPKVIRVWDTDKNRCILREYVDGKPCSDFKAKLSDSDVIRIGIKLCDILSYLHGLKPPIIHRDVKPENIILRDDGTPVLIDFGIARLYCDSAPADTRIMGTECFAPPEQYGFQQTDARSDIYSLGVTLRWLLKESDSRQTRREKSLMSVLNRCTAFSPEERYNDATSLKKALKRCETSTIRSALVIAFACIALLAAAVYVPIRISRATRFDEPMIEQAVRASLGISENTHLTRDMLEQVTGIYIYADKVCADADEFYSFSSEWYASDRRHGPITSLEDVGKLPSLANVLIAAERITDITPLENLEYLEKLELKHNSVSDISPLSGMPALASVAINDNPVSDLTPLKTLPALMYLDLCDAHSYNPAVIGELRAFEFLDISNHTESWKYLGKRFVRDLRLGWSGLDSLDPLEGIAGLEHLDITHTDVRSLEGIEQHDDIRYLRISGCVIDDLTPLLKLPKLDTLVVGEDMKDDVAALGISGLTVQYE